MQYLKNFKTKKIIELLRQKNFPIEFFDQNYIDFKVKDYESYIILSFKENILKINLPIQFNSLMNQIIEKVKDYKITFNDISYYPFNESIFYNNSTIKLRNTHNLIMRNIILNYQEGISKNELYKIIWPKDFEIQINKIDTHLTNLKNFLFNEINYRLKYSTHNSIVKFDL